MGLIIRSSAIHAAGCYTTTPITSGTRVAEYTGHRITKDVADARYENSIVTYLFGIGDGEYVIDGHGAAMFINHSCDPNCETDEIDGRVWIMAIREIAQDEELTYDYNLYDGGDDEATCNCGAQNCRQTMYSEEEIRRRKREAATSLKKKKKEASKKRAAHREKKSAKKVGQRKSRRAVGGAVPPGSLRRKTAPVTAKGTPAKKIAPAKKTLKRR